MDIQKRLLPKQKPYKTNFFNLTKRTSTLIIFVSRKIKSMMNYGDSAEKR